MKILTLNYEYPPLGGGAGNATHYLLKEFSKIDGVEIDLVTSSSGKSKEESVSKNIKVYFLDIGKKRNFHYQSYRDLLTYTYKAYGYCKTLVSKNNYDVCHAFFGIPCGWIARKLKVPYIVSLRGSDVPFYNQRFRVLDKLVFQNLSKNIWKEAKAVVANSQGLRALALTTNTDQKIGVIENGVNTEEIFSKDRGIRDFNVINLTAVGRLIKRKGYEYLIKAISCDKKFKLSIIGGGNIKNELIDLSKKYNSNVVFLGEKTHNEVVAHLQEADIFVLSSLNEGMSNATLEAMACGLPIISTDVGGAQELIKNNGIIVKKASAEAIRKALDSYKSDTSLIKEHGAKSFEIAQEMTWQKTAEAYLKKYKSLVV